MSGPLSTFCNRAFISNLRQLGDMNVLLLMVDGSAVFGRLADIPTASGVLRVVQSIGVPFPPGIASGVVFRPANPDLIDPIVVSQLYVDVNDVAFVIWGTFATLPLFFDLVSPLKTNSATPSEESTISTANTAAEPGTRQGHFGTYPIGFNSGWCVLLSVLRDLTVRNIGLVTLGGWTVTGQLGQVIDGVALINPATATIPLVTTAGSLTISGPAIPGGILTISTSVSAWANLTTLTQILQP